MDRKEVIMIETIICILSVLAFVLGLFIGKEIGEYQTMEYIINELRGD